MSIALRTKKKERDDSDKSRAFLNKHELDYNRLSERVRIHWNTLYSAELIWVLTVRNSGTQTLQWNSEFMPVVDQLRIDTVIIISVEKCDYHLSFFSLKL